MNKITLIGLVLTTAFFTGCGASFNSLVGVPNTKEEMVQKNDDKVLAEALSSIMDQKNDKKLDRTIDLGIVNTGIINLRAYNFIRFKDGVVNGNFSERLEELLENSFPMKTFVNVATKRGNKVKAYSGKINYYVFGLDGKDVNIWRTGQNVSYIYEFGPTYIEFDKNNRIVSIISHYHDKYYEYNNSAGRISVDTNFFIVTGAKAKSKQGQLTNKILEENFLFDVN